MNAVRGSLSGPPPTFDALTTGLEERGFVVQPDGLPADVALVLSEYAAATRYADFHPAAVGRGSDQQRNRFVRRDRIHWIDERNPSLLPWCAWTESLRMHLNRRLFLGLFSFESQLAHYRPGDFYRIHFNAFRSEANRVVSLVTDLNECWKEGDGGELVLHIGSDPLTVAPVCRTVVLFLSAAVPHEVVPARRDRYSVAGWFRLNSSSPDRVDPPR